MRQCRLFLLPIFLIFYVDLIVFAQEKSVQTVKEIVTHLASDKLKGRMTATPSEKKAARYISGYWKKNNIPPYKDHDYFIPFTFQVIDKKKDAYIRSRNFEWKENDSVRALPYSAHHHIEAPVVYVGFGIAKPERDDYAGKSVKGSIVLINHSLPDSYHPHSPYYDQSDFAVRVKTAKEKGAAGVIFYKTDKNGPEVENDIKHQTPCLDLPVFYCDFDLTGYIKEGQTIELFTHFVRTKKTGTNVAAMINNGAEKTIVIGAHYDHLGKGGENSLHRGEAAIHNGADDNASGVAGMLYLAKKLQGKEYKNHNYLLIAFSGEELGLLGSSAFVKSLTEEERKKILCMFNFDMIGRLDSLHRNLAIYGNGTASEWNKLTEAHGRNFIVTFHEEGIGPSDHTSFYLADIPVLHFFTGQHADYHKPSDDADKINYRGIVEIAEMVGAIIKDMQNLSHLSFQKTNSSTQTKSRKYKVTLGIVPDYLFSGTGVKVDGVTEGKPAAVAGIKTGDIIVRIGNMEVLDIQGYMAALSRYEKGQQVEVEVVRQGERRVVKVTF